MSREDFLLAQAKTFLRLLRENHQPDDGLVTAFHDFYLVVAEVLLQVMKIRNVPRDRREDVIQKVWVAIVKRLGGPAADEVQDLAGWVYGMACHKVGDVFREMRHHRTVSLEGETDEPMDPHTKGAFEQAARGELHEFWESWMAEMVHDRNGAINCELMRGRWLEQRGDKDLAAATGLTEDAVRSRLKRLKKRFLAQLSQRCGDDPPPQ